MLASTSAFIARYWESSEHRREIHSGRLVRIKRDIDLALSFAFYETEIFVFSALIFFNGSNQ